MQLKIEGAAALYDSSLFILSLYSLSLSEAYRLTILCDLSLSPGDDLVLPIFLTFFEELKIITNKLSKA